MVTLRLLIACAIVLTILSQGKATWTYNDVERLEGPYQRSLLSRVKSDNLDTDHYIMETDGFDYFTLDEKTGEITQYKDFDYETQQTYTISVTAYDADNNPTEDTVSFLVHVLDKNDNSPVFIESSLTGYVEEAYSRGFSSEPFMTVSATDADSGINAQIVYSIKEDTIGTVGSASGTRFVIDPISGAVRLSNTAVLDYEKVPSLTFTVIAADNNGSDPKYTNEAIVRINVKDSNDHAPVFDPDPHPFSIPENKDVDKAVYDIFAIDEDEGVNKKVYFEISGGNTGGVFKILSIPSSTGKSSGQLQLGKKLDFESGVTAYYLEIVAYNKEASNYADTAFTTISKLNITVIDVNEPPIFKNTPYSATVTEGPSGYKGKPVPLLTIFAEDLDFDRNQSVTYSLNQNENWFAIDAISGLITQTEEVDREHSAVDNGVYKLKVVATDNYDNGPRGSQEQIVEIIVNDINDNSPMVVWGQEGREVEICEKPINRTVTVVTVSDPDSAKNGPEFIFQLNDSISNSQWGFERVSNVSQKLIMKFLEYSLTSGSEVITIPFTITDSGVMPQTSAASIIVKICKCDEKGVSLCQATTHSEFPLAIILVVIAVILLLMVLMFAATKYKRSQTEKPVGEEDALIQSYQVYAEECGEVDGHAYDLKKIYLPDSEPLSLPKTCPASDFLLLFNFEGCGSVAGSLSSINSVTTDGSIDCDYLNDWGPKFKKIAEMYSK